MSNQHPRGEKISRRYIGKLKRSKAKKDGQRFNTERRAKLAGCKGKHDLCILCADYYHRRIHIYGVDSIKPGRLVP